MNYHTTLISRNAKTGPMPVVTSSATTCPTSCPFREKGCYAKTGPLALHWNKVTEQKIGGDLDEALKPIRKLNRGALWRYGQAGDLPGEGDNIDRDALLKIAHANRGKRAIVFTHKPATKSNLMALYEARDQGLVINLSANNFDHADEQASTGLPVVMVLSKDYARKRKGKIWEETLREFKERTRKLRRKTSANRKVALCPATYLDVSCTECGVCANADRNGVIVGFPAHGTYKTHVSNLAGSG